MNNVKRIFNTAADIVCKEVLTYLKNKQPDIDFHAESHLVSTFEYTLVWNVYMIKGYGPSFLRRIFPKKIARIDGSACGEDITYKTYQPNLISQKTLESFFRGREEEMERIEFTAASEARRHTE